MTSLDNAIKEARKKYQQTKDSVDYEAWKRLQDQRELEMSNRESLVRQCNAHLDHNGLRTLLRDKQFDNYSHCQEWQLDLYEKVIEFVRTVINGGKGWMYISGQSGCGKTHLCCAAINTFFKHNRPVWFEMWPTMSELINQRHFGRLTEDAEKTIRKAKSAPILYIDDLFKGGVNDKDLKPLFDILNHRYNQQFITMISTERAISEIQDIDEAIAGRIYEMCKQEGGVMIHTKRNPERNFRMATQI